MKKVILFLTIIVTITAVTFAVLEVSNYYNKKKKIDNNTMIQEIEDKIKEVENTIKEKEEQENKVKEEKKDKIEELEKWQKKVKEMEENL